MAVAIIFIFSVLMLSFTLIDSLTPEQLQNDLNQAIASERINNYTIPKGDYHFINQNFLIHNAKDFSIYSSASTIFYFNCTYEVSIVNNINVSIFNMIIDYDPPCFSQCVLNDFNITESSLIVSIDDGYPLPDKRINPIFGANVVKVIYWNSTTRNMIVGQPVSNKMKSSESLNNNKYKIYLQSNITHFIPTIGDLITIGPRIGATHMSTNCTNMTITNLTIYSSPNMACVEMLGGGGNVYDNYQLIRKPNSQHLITSNADAFHSNMNVKGPTLRNSKLMYPGDDFVNVHNRINILLERISDFEVYIIDTNKGDTLKQVKSSDYIYFYQLNSYKYFGYGIVDILYKDNNQTLIEEAKNSENVLESPPYNAKFVVNYTNEVAVYYVKFMNKLNENITAYWSLVEFDLNNNALIENNLFYNGYSSIAKIKSKYAIFRNNIAKYTHSGIHVAAEQTWLEGELGLKNIIIANNMIIGCNVTEKNAIVIQSTATNVTVVNNTVIT